MSKDKTPIEEAITKVNGIYELIELNELKGLNSMNHSALQISLDRVRFLLTKEKEQREELIKNAVIYGIEYGEDYLRYSHNQVKKIADSYYNNHIKKGN